MMEPIHRSAPRWSVAVLAAAFSLSPAGRPLAAQPSAPRYTDAFVLRRAADTIAIERFTRTATELVGEIALRDQGRLTYRAVLEPRALVRRIAFEQRPAAGGSPDGAPTGATLTFRPTVVEVATSGAGRGAPPTRVPTEQGAVPFANPSFALTEQILLRARAIAPASAATGTHMTVVRDSTRVPVFALAGGQTLVATVVWLAGDSAVLTLGGAEVRAAVDAHGQLRGAIVPAQGLTIERVPAGAVTSTVTPGADSSGRDGRPAPGRAPITGP